ncbi:LysR family transcriptional regulator [Burkholderia sp. Ax-1719]|nr:LysR family transcriptional regulator [Burkholderia sp. Ax-1719]
MIDVKRLRYFVALAEVRHFGKAAALLDITQPPLSRQLNALEAALGVQLLERSSRRVELTPAGRQFYQDARLILEKLQQAERNAKAVAAGEIANAAKKNKTTNLVKGVRGSLA